MKKLILLPLLMLGMALSAQTTGFKAGVHLGFPVGNASDVSGFNFGLDAAYLWDVAPNFKAGVTTGYTHFIGKNIKENTLLGSYSHKMPDFGFIPIAGTAEYNFTPKIFGAVDLGYAIATQEHSNGGFYWQPKVGLNVDAFQVYAYYKNISDNLTLSSLGVGAAYNF